MQRSVLRMIAVGCPVAPRARPAGRPRRLDEASASARRREASCRFCTESSPAYNASTNNCLGTGAMRL